MVDVWTLKVNSFEVEPWSQVGYPMSRENYRGKISPRGYFPWFFLKTYLPIFIFWSLTSPNFDGIKLFYYKNRQAIL